MRLPHGSLGRTKAHHPIPQGETMTTFRRLISSIDSWTLEAFNAPTELRSR